MSEKKLYAKVSFGEDSDTFIEDPSLVSVEDLLQDEGDIYRIEAVMMTPEEVALLPEFTGF